MDCSICWDEFETSAFSLICGHLFHRKCIQHLIDKNPGSILCPLCRKKGSSTFHPSYIRAVFFTSVTNAPKLSSEADFKKALEEARKDQAIKNQTVARTRAQNNRLRLNDLRALQQKEASAEREAVLLRQLEAMTRARDAALEWVSDVRAERDGWVDHARALEEKVADNEREVAEIMQLNKSMKKINRRLKKAEEERPSNREAVTRADSPVPQRVLRARKGVRRERSTETLSGLSDTYGASTTIELRQPPVEPTPPQIASISRRSLGQRNDVPNPGSGPSSPSYPQEAVPECSAEDGNHHYSRIGSNQYKTRYTCKICGFVKSENVRV